MEIVKELKRAFIKEEFVAITEDCAEAIILNQMVCLSEMASDFDEFVEEEKQRQLKYNLLPDGEVLMELPLLHGWISKKASQLKEEIMSTDSDRTIKRKLDRLVEKKFLDRRRDPKFKYDRTYQYRINIPNIIMALKHQGYTLEDCKIDLSIYYKPLEA